MRNPKTPSIGEIQLKESTKSQAAREAAESKAKDECFILSLDGGGMRGIISTTVLSGFCQIMKDKSYFKPLHEMFDMVAGTSTGGLIATAITCPSLIGRSLEEGYGLPDPQTLGRIYMNYGKDIFSEPVPSILNTVLDKYSPKAIERLLKLWYGDALFSSCVIPTLVMGYNATAGLPFPMASTEVKSLYTWEVDRGTSAAPTYFPPLQLGRHLIIDGGVIANNPSLYAYRYARNLWPQCKKLHILSISTCSNIYKYTSQSTYGVSSWAGVYKVYANAQMQTTDEMMECLPDVDYLRIYQELERKIEMDDASEEALVHMEDFGNRLFKQFKPELEAFADRLLAIKNPSSAVQPPQPEIPRKKPSFLQRIRKWVKR